MVTLYVFIIALTEIALSESKQHIPFIKKKERKKKNSQQTPTPLQCNEGEIKTGRQILYGDKTDGNIDTDKKKATKE